MKINEIIKDIRNLRDADSHVCNEDLVEKHASEMKDLEASLEWFETREPNETTSILCIKQRMQELTPDNELCSCLEYDKIIDKLEQLK